METMKEEKRKEWRAKGYSEKLINMATELAQEWAFRMSEVFAPPEMREVAVRHNLPKGLEVADRWITRFGEALKEKMKVIQGALEKFIDELSESISREEKEKVEKALNKFFRLWEAFGEFLEELEAENRETKGGGQGEGGKG